MEIGIEVVVLTNLVEKVGDAVFVQMVRELYNVKAYIFPVLSIGSTKSGVEMFLTTHSN